jgi:hypothetical protein
LFDASGPRPIAELYAVEAGARGQTAERRQITRRITSLPLVEVMKSWLTTELTRLPLRSALGDAIRYDLTRWTALCPFLDDGSIELDNTGLKSVFTRAD